MSHRNIFVFFLASLILSCASSPIYQVHADLYGEKISTTVDSYLTKYYLESYLADRRSNHELDLEIDTIYTDYDRAIPSRSDLASISERGSVDFASIFFVDRLLENECNKVLHQTFLEYQPMTTPITAAPSYTILFVPGWDYEENGHVTGADFAEPLKVAQEFGFSSFRIDVPPTGGVEGNAKYFAEQITKHTRSGSPVIVVGASSAGPAIHLALSELIDSNDLNSVKAWLNLGGILQGTGLIEYLQQFPRNWLFRLISWWHGWDIEHVRTMGAKVSQDRFGRLRLPKDLFILNYVGVPLSGQLSYLSKDTYPILKANGPNDGLTLLADIVVPESLTITAIGNDHFFGEDPRIRSKTIALMRLLVEQIENKPLVECF